MLVIAVDLWIDIFLTCFQTSLTENSWRTKSVLQIFSDDLLLLFRKFLYDVLEFDISLLLTTPFKFDFFVTNFGTELLIRVLRPFERIWEIGDVDIPFKIFDSSFTPLFNREKFIGLKLAVEKVLNLFNIGLIIKVCWNSCVPVKRIIFNNWRLHLLCYRWL